MKNKKATNKQVLDAYGQSYRLMKLAKRNDDKNLRNKSEQLKNIFAKGNTSNAR